METGTLRIVLDPSTNLVAAHLEPEFELEHAPPPPPPLTDDETEMEALYEVCCLAALLQFYHGRPRLVAVGPSRAVTRIRA